MAANNTPDFRTISDFPKHHLKALAGLFLQVLKLCQKAGLVKLGHVALDGTKIGANASKQKAMSYKRMKEEEARLDNEVAKLMAKAEAVDEEEDCRYGKDKRGDESPGELAFRESRLKKIREAKAALEAEANRDAEAAGSVNKKHSGVPDDKAQRNFTDPESRIMPAPGGKHFIQAYIAQAAGDSAHQVIVAAEVIDKRAQKIDVYMPPDKMGRRVALPPTPRRRIPKNLSAFPHSYRENLIATLSPHPLPPGPSAIHRLLRHTPITFAYQLSVPRAYIEADRNVREFALSCENGDPS